MVYGALCHRGPMTSRPSRTTKLPNDTDRDLRLECTCVLPLIGTASRLDAACAAGPDDDVSTVERRFRRNTWRWFHAGIVGRAMAMRSANSGIDSPLRGDGVSQASGWLGGDDERQGLGLQVEPRSVATAVVGCGWRLAGASAWLLPHAGARWGSPPSPSQAPLAPAHHFFRFSSSIIIPAPPAAIPLEAAHFPLLPSIFFSSVFLPGAICRAASCLRFPRPSCCAVVLFGLGRHGPSVSCHRELASRWLARASRAPTTAIATSRRVAARIGRPRLHLSPKYHKLTFSLF
jgi:hypothetical protein